MGISKRLGGEQQTTKHRERLRPSRHTVAEAAERSSTAGDQFRRDTADRGAATPAAVAGICLRDRVPVLSRFALSCFARRLATADSHAFAKFLAFLGCHLFPALPHAMPPLPVSAIARAWPAVEATPPAEENPA